MHSTSTRGSVTCCVNIMASLAWRTQDTEVEGRYPLRQGPQRQQPRLPTPERSLGSYNAFDETKADTSMSNAGSRRAMDFRDSYQPTSRRRDSHHNVFPRSPPYDLPDSHQRPSLPPLKTVSTSNIGDTTSLTFVRYSVMPLRVLLKRQQPGALHYNLFPVSLR
jgi:hypothetical protein